MSFAHKQFRLLVVDDNPAIHDDFKKILVPEEDQIHNKQMAEIKQALFGHETSQKMPISYSIDSAYSGPEALRLVTQAQQEKNPYALAFMDVLMPTGWDGIETTKHLWQVDPDIQIVICTAYADYSWDDMIRQLGINDNFLILKKPFDNVEVKQLACCLTQKWLLNQQIGHQFDRINSELTKKSEDFESWSKTP